MVSFQTKIIQNEIMKILLTSLFIFLISSAFAQDGESSVWLINGKKLTLSNYKFVENGNYLAYEKKPGKIKELPNPKHILTIKVCALSGVEKLPYKEE